MCPFSVLFQPRRHIAGLTHREPKCWTEHDTQHAADNETDAKVSEDCTDDATDGRSCCQSDTGVLGSLLVVVSVCRCHGSFPCKVNSDNGRGLCVIVPAARCKSNDHHPTAEHR